MRGQKHTWEVKSYPSDADNLLGNDRDQDDDDRDRRRKDQNPIPVRDFRFFDSSGQLDFDEDYYEDRLLRRANIS